MKLPQNYITTFRALFTYIITWSRKD